MKEHIVFIIVSILGLLGFYPLQSQTSSLSKESFFSPDSTYYPGVWWWWLRCPTTKEAITLDLEEMKAKKSIVCNYWILALVEGRKGCRNIWNWLLQNGMNLCDILSLNVNV